MMVNNWIIMLPIMNTMIFTGKTAGMRAIRRQKHSLQPQMPQLWTVRRMKPTIPIDEKGNRQKFLTVSLFWEFPRNIGQRRSTQKKIMVKVHNFKIIIYAKEIKRKNI